MADSLDRAAVKAAVRTILRAVPRVGRVADYLGQQPDGGGSRGAVEAETWPYWEVSVNRISESLTAAEEETDERPVLAVEGWFPWNGDGGSEDFWDSLVPLAKDALRSHRTLSGTVNDSEPPQETENDLRPYNTRREEPLCHHVLLEVEIKHEFTYDLI